jgi:Fur family ferric uptake transcriptional regulator
VPSSATTIGAVGEIHDEVKRTLAKHGVQYTRGRRAVIRALQMMSGPATAADIHADLDAAPLSSLYRSLTVLNDMGVIRKHHDSDGLARFELAEWLGGHHHHVVCLNCGSVEDVSVDSRTETMLEGLATSLATAVGYEPSGHVLEIEGLCRHCRVNRAAR